jgi:hypothetical protein
MNHGPGRSMMGSRLGDDVDSPELCRTTGSWRGAHREDSRRKRWSSMVAHRGGVADASRWC